MKHLLALLVVLASGPAMAATDLTKDDLVGHWVCHESREGTTQTSQLIYRSNGRFKIKFKMLFVDSPTSSGMRGTLNGKWSIKGDILTMRVLRSQVYLTANGGRVTTGKVGRTISLSDQTSHSGIVEYDGENMVIEAKSGAGPMICKRSK